jgi:hypothetical protein
MSNLVKICFASLIAGWMIPDPNLASPVQAFQQQTTPTAPATSDKQPETPAKSHQPRPNPDASGKYHVGDGVTAPVLIHSEEPKMSKNMRKANISGSCLVAVTVNTNGDPADVHIVRSTLDPNDKEVRDVAIGLQDICIEAAQKYRFQPATFQGKPVPVDLKVEIIFQKS